MNDKGFCREVVCWYNDSKNTISIYDLMLGGWMNDANKGMKRLVWLCVELNEEMEKQWMLVDDGVLFERLKGWKVDEWVSMEQWNYDWW